MAYKAIVSDVDGTLAPIALHSVVSVPVKDAIYRCMQHGLYFTIATGKPYSLVEGLTTELQLRSPLIVDNGAAIYDPLSKRLLCDFPIHAHTVYTLLAFVSRHCTEYRVSCRATNIHNSTQLPVGEVVRKIVLLDLTLKQTSALMFELLRQFEGLNIIQSSSDKGDAYHSIYISSPEATKQHAVSKVAQILDISTSEVIGVGDHHNDFSLLAACGFKVAMGNAVPELKEMADYVAPSVDDDGLADVLNRCIDRRAPFDNPI